MSTSLARRGPGPREFRRTVRQRERRRRAFLATVGLVALAAAAGVGLVMLDGEPLAPPAQPPPAREVATSPETVLLVSHPTAGGAATSVTLLAYGSERATAVFLPLGTLVEIPGVGRDLLAAAHQYGGAQLVEATVENLLGIAITHVVTVSERGFASFFSRAGGLEVTLAERVVDRGEGEQADLRFEAGPQFLNGTRASALWAYDGDGELAAFTRRQVLLEALLDKVDADAGLARSLAGTPQLVGAAANREIAGALEQLATAHAQERLSVTLLPVEPFGGQAADGTATYRVREQEAAALGAQLGAGVTAEALRVQVLNGVGVPGIGQEVERRLAGGRFRVVLTENARSFDFAETRLIVYDDAADTLRAARAVRQLLGVGSISVSRQPQSVVDLTIVVGADFAERVTDSEE